MSQKKHCAVCNLVVKRGKGCFSITGSSIEKVFRLQGLYGINSNIGDKRTEMTKMTGNPFYARGPVEPRYFANRSELIQLFVQNVEDAAQNKNTKPDNMSNMIVKVI